MEDTGIITTCGNGVDVVFEWKIENFFNLPERDVGYYCSPFFYFGGERWRLIIYPNGSSERWELGIFPNGWSRNNSSGHVDLELGKCFSDRSIRQSVSLSLKTARGEKYSEQHLLEDFGNFNLTHKFNRFIPRSELRKRRSELVPEGDLTLICTMKGSTSAGSASNSASAECRHCKGTFNADSLSSHQKKCMSRTIKCPDCFEVVLLEKWLNEHECQQERPEGDGSLCQDFKKLLVEGLNHDLILKVGDKELRAHRDVLRARSQVFKAMLDHDMKEKKSGIIDIPDCDLLAMEQFLFYIYSGNIEVLDQSNMLNLYYIADKYEMKGLKKECSDFIKESLSQANICGVIQLALNHSDSSLLESTTVYFRNNMLDIMRTVEWQVFMKENSTVANELLIKAVENLSNVKS